MTTEQITLFNRLVEKYSLKKVDLNPKEVYAYFFTVLGIGSGMTEEEIETYLQADSFLQMDVMRTSSYLGIPLPPDEKQNAWESMRNYIHRLKEEAEKNKQIEMIKEESKEEMETPDVETEVKDMEVPDNKEGKENHSPEESPDIHDKIMNRILSDKNFRADQIKMIERALDAGMEETYLLQIADSSVSAGQMEQFISIYEKKKENKKEESSHERRVKHASAGHADLRKGIKRIWKVSETIGKGGRKGNTAGSD